MCSFWTPGDGRKNCLNHVERLTEINKFWNAASCWLYSANVLAMHGPMIVKWRILFITHTLEHNYILPSSTVRIQLHISAPIFGPSSGWDSTYRSTIQDVWGVCLGIGLGEGGGERDLVVSIMGTMTQGCYKWIFSLVVYVHMSSWLLFLC